MWVLPLPTGEPRRFADIHGQDVTYTSDGRVIFTNGDELYSAQRDGSSIHKLIGLPGFVTNLGISPDKKRLRFTI
jgi:hypothetical protein